MDVNDPLNILSRRRKIPFNLGPIPTRHGAPFLIPAKEARNHHDGVPIDIVFIDKVAQLGCSVNHGQPIKGRKPGVRSTV